MATFTRSHLVGASVLGLIALVTLVSLTLAPVYGFFAHRGALPFTPLGWTDMPTSTAPHVHETLDNVLETEGREAILRLAAYRDSIGVPALSAAVSIRGEVVWHGSAGWADVEAGVPATPETSFRIGSTSKAVTATALARLVDRGEIDLDAPIATYLADLPNPQWADLTARQLVSHTAGLPHYDGIEDLLGFYQNLAMNTSFATPADALSQFDDSDLLHAPGSDYHYSSLGTVLLGAVMSAATDLPYTELVAREVIEPAGMVSTYADPGRNPDRDQPHVARMAQFYYIDDGRVRRWRPVDLSGRLPGGGWVSTPTDLVRMGDLMLSDSILDAETRTVFWAPQALSDGRTSSDNYALGWRWREWEVDGFGQVRNANHGGVSRGSQAWLLVFPDLDMSIAFAINAKTESFSDFGLFFRDLVQVFGPVARERSNRSDRGDGE